jgi:hypothetical protein
MKRCTKCGVTKPIAEFYRCKRDGLYPSCKVCARLASKKSYASGGRERKKRPTEEQRKRARQSEKGKARRRRAKAKARGTNKHNARKAISDRVYRGTMAKATTLECRECGKPAAQYHHHLGYEREHWLDVVPLCCECHKAEHRKKP